MSSPSSSNRKLSTAFSRFGSFVTPVLCIFLCIFGFCYWQLQNEFNEARDNLRILRKQFIEVSESRRSLESTLHDKANMLSTLQKDLSDIQQVQSKHNDEMIEANRRLEEAKNELKPMQDKLNDAENRANEAKKNGDSCNGLLVSIKESVGNPENLGEHIKKINADLMECQKKVVAPPPKQEVTQEKPK